MRPQLVADRGKPLEVTLVVLRHARVQTLDLSIELCEASLGGLLLLLDGTALRTTEGGAGSRSGTTLSR